MPVTWAEKAPENWFPAGEELQGTAVSDDNGKTWKLSGEVKAPKWALENMIVELKEGRLWMLIRTGAGCLYQSFSNDHGQTWSEGEPADIVNPGTRFFIRRLRSGRLLLINTPDPKQRKGLYAYLSDPDDDTDFGPGLELDPRDRVSYPDAVEAQDGLVYAVHDFDRQGAGEIVLNVFSENEISVLNKKF